MAISNQGGVKRMRKEVIIMIWVHETRNKERINVKNIKNIKESEKKVSTGRKLTDHKTRNDLVI